LERLDPATVSVVWNLKIVATALLLRFAMGKLLSWRQWIAIMVLTAGVLTTQAGSLSAVAPEHGSTKVVAAAEKEQSRHIVGIMLCLVSIGINTGANVTCEYLFKRTRGSQYAQYARLYVFGVAMNLVCLVVRDGATVMAGNLFQGYDWWTVAVITVLSGAGFLVGMTFKHVDNIAVVFADCSAMIYVSIVSWLCFGLKLTPLFIGGVTLCGGAIWLYYGGEDKDKASALEEYKAVKTTDERSPVLRCASEGENPDMPPLVDSDEDINDFE
jgi:solute carrier family 35 (UDP-sugar transporter), member A1/2/3